MAVFSTIRRFVESMFVLKRSFEQENACAPRDWKDTSVAEYCTTPRTATAGATIYSPTTVSTP
tara:strand:+ start:464 stop:652 length:189 start_codon:yes stop_codon:yes gene_type:complete